MKNKLFIPLFVVSLTLFIFTGCTGKTTTSTAEATTTSAEPTAVAEQTADTVEESSAGTLEDKDFQLGVRTNNSYNNQFFGISFEAPEGWTVANEEQIKQMNGELSDLSDNEEIKKAIEQGQTIFEFFATSSDSLQNVNILIERSGIAISSLVNTALNLESSIPLVKQQLESHGMTDIKAKVGKIQFLGEEMNCLNVNATYNNIPVYMKQILLSQSGFFCSITASSFKDNLTQEVLDHFQMTE